MRIRYIVIILGLLLLLMTMISCQSSVVSTTSKSQLVVDNLDTVLSSGVPVIAEFGRGTCIPCKQMKPILEELSIEYQGRLYVAIISVDQYRDLTYQNGIMAIPTQIFYDGNGKEVARHIGFYAKEDIITQLKKMGIE